MIAGPAVYDAHKTPMSAVHEICGEVASWSRRRGSSIPVDGVWACLRDLLESLLAPYARSAHGVDGWTAAAHSPFARALI